jgi:hypothetical protein
MLWRERRSNILAHAACFDQATIQPVRTERYEQGKWPAADARVQEAGVGTLLLSGFVRGAPLHASQIMHLPGIGDFQIEAVRGPFSAAVDVCR